MAAVTTDTDAWVDDDAFMLHRQGICRANIDAFTAQDARIGKKDGGFALSLDLPADVSAQHKGDDQGVEKPGLLLHLDAQEIVLDQVPGIQLGVQGGADPKLLLKPSAMMGMLLGSYPMICACA